MVHSNKRMSVVAQASYQGCLPRLKKTNHSRKNPTILPIAFFNHIIMKLFIESIDYGINVIRLSYRGRCWVVAILNVLASSAVDRGFELRSGQTKMTIKSVAVVSSAKHTALRRKNRDIGWLGIRIMCPSGATCLSAHCCFSQLAL